MAIAPPVDLNSILARIGNPKQFVGFATQPYQDVLAQAWQAAAQNLANLDLQAGDVRNKYERGVADTVTQRAQALEGVRNAIANRGMGFSGANIDAQARTNKSYDDRVFNLGEARTNSLRDIAARRLGIESDYGNRQAQAYLDMTTQASQFLRDQAAKDYQAKLAAAQTPAPAPVVQPAAPTPPMVVTNAMTSQARTPLPRPPKVAPGKVGFF